MARRKRTEPVNAQQQRPRYGSWNERDATGWTICEKHDYGVGPGRRCLSCTLNCPEVQR